MGDSLAPEFQHGDFVLVSKIPFLFVPPISWGCNRLPPARVWAADQAHPKLNPDGGVNVIGNHPESIDSRVFGTVRREDMIGKVIWHIRKP